MTLSQFFKTISEASRTFWKNKKYIVLLVLLDIVFYYLFRTLHVNVFKQLAGHLTVATQIIQMQVSKVAEAAELLDLNNALMQNQQFTTEYDAVLKYVLLLFLGMLGLWTGFKGAQWYLAKKLVFGQVSFVKYFLKFAVYTLFWFVVLVILLAINVSLASSAKTSILPILGPTGTSILTSLFMLLLSYFTFISYLVVPEEKTLRKTYQLGVKKAGTFVPVFIVMLLVTFVAATLPVTIGNKYIAIVLFVFITLPAVVWTRIYLATAVKHCLRTIR